MDALVFMLRKVQVAQPGLEMNLVEVGAVSSPYCVIRAVGWDVGHPQSSVWVVHHVEEVGEELLLCWVRGSHLMSHLEGPVSQTHEVRAIVNDFEGLQVWEDGCRSCHGINSVSRYMESQVADLV